MKTQTSLKIALCWWAFVAVFFLLLVIGLLLISFSEKHGTSQGEWRFMLAIGSLFAALGGYGIRRFFQTRRSIKENMVKSPEATSH